MQPAISSVKAWSVTARYLRVCTLSIKPLTAKKQTTESTSANLKKNVSYRLCHIVNSKTREQSVDLDETAQVEPFHQDLRCLQIQLFFSPALKVLTEYSNMTLTFFPLSI